MKHKATFEITGVVQKKAIYGKLARLRLEVDRGPPKGGKEYFEVISFRPGELDQVGEGEEVTIKGRPNRRKLDNVKQVGKDGVEYDFWETQLIANAILPSDVVVQQGPKHTTAPASSVKQESLPVPGGPLPGDDNVPF